MPYYAAVADEWEGPFFQLEEASTRMYMMMNEAMSEGVETGITVAKVFFSAVTDGDFDEDEDLKLLVEYIAVPDEERNAVVSPGELGYDWHGWAKWGLVYHYLLMPAGKKNSDKSISESQVGEYVSKSGLLMYFESKLEQLRMATWETDSIALLENIVSDIENDFGVADLEKESRSLESLRQELEERRSEV